MGKEKFKGGGRPDLAGGADPNFVMVDQIRNEEGEPSKITFEEVYQAANTMFQLDREGSRQLVKDYIANGGNLTSAIPKVLTPIFDEAKAEKVCGYAYDGRRETRDEPQDDLRGDHEPGRTGWSSSG